MLLIILAVLGGLALFVTVIAIIVMMLLMIQSIRDQRDTLTLQKINTTRADGIEKLLLIIHTMLTAEIAQANAGIMDPSTILGGLNIGHHHGKFVTEDGRHEADTFEKLIRKISDDPRYRVAKDEDVEKLREQFENHSRELGEGEDEEGEDEEDEKWKEGDSEKNGS